MQPGNSTRAKLLVRHVSLNKFLGANGRWVKSAKAAASFPNLLNAFNTCLGRGIKNVELIVRFEGEVSDRRVPLDAIQ
jgi:hypothetical protein